MLFILSGIAHRNCHGLRIPIHTMDIMATPKQIEASRINGRRSKGPVTPQGKLNSSGNNSRHGLLAQTVVLEGESEEGFNALLEYYTQTHQPQSAIEAR